MAFVGGIRRPEATSFSKVIEGQDTIKKSLDLGYKAILAQNCRFSDEVGSATKRQTTAYYNTSEVTESGLATPINSLYRYYKQLDGTQYLFQLHTTLLQVGDDSAGTFSTIATLPLSSGHRFTAVTYKDLALISTGYDPIIQSDGLAAWELGSCKAALKVEAGNVDSGTHHYAVSFSIATGESTNRNGAATSTTASKLVDSNANFGAEANPTKVGMVVTNITTTDNVNNWGVITNIDSTTTLSIQSTNTNLFTSGDLYTIAIPVTGDSINGAKSNVVTTDTSSTGKVTLSYIPLGPLDCIARNIYRTAAAGTQLKFLTRLNDNTTTTYEDNIADSGLGDTLSSVVTDPIPTGKYLHITDERIFVTGDIGDNRGSYMYFSETYLPHYFPYDNYDIVGDDEGDVITGIKDLLGMTFVFKQNSIRPWYISGLPDTWSMGKILSTIGCPVPYSITNIANGIVYQGWDHMQMFNGQYSQPILDEFNIASEVLEVRRTLSVGLFWNNLYLMAYTDLTSANGYHDRVLVWDTLRNQLSVDKGGAITQGSGNTQINCFAAMKGHNEWGQLYAGDSQRGFVYQYERIINELSLTTVTDLNLGTYTNSMAVGEENNPTLSKYVLDNMETYSTDELAQAAWVTSVTDEKMPPDLGTGLDADPAITTDVTWASDKNCIDCTITSGTVTISGTVYIKCQGTFSNAGTITITPGSTLYIWAYTVTNTGTINGNVYIKANTIDNSGSLYNEMISQAAHYASGGSNPALGYDGNWSTAHTASGSGGGGGFADVWVSCTHIFPTTVTITSLRYKGTVTLSTSNTYVNSATSAEILDDKGQPVLGTGSGSSGPGVSQAGGANVSYDSTMTDVWNNVESIRVTSDGHVFGTENAVTITSDIYDIQVFADIHCYYQHSSGTVPTSGDITDFIDALQVFSEAGIVNQGVYSLRVLCAGSNGSGGGYGTNVLTGGTASASSELALYPASKALDGDETMTDYHYWMTDNTAEPSMPHWWQYDLGSGRRSRVTKLRILPAWLQGIPDTIFVRDFELDGSYDGSNWVPVYSDTANNYPGIWQEFTFTNDFSYRYYRLNISNSYREIYYPYDHNAGIVEIEMIGDSSSTTDTLDGTITKSINALDLSDAANSHILIDVYVERTGTNIQFGMGEGAIDAWKDITISTANTWTTLDLDFSGVYPANRDAIDTIAIKFTNADSFNRVFFDNIRSALYGEDLQVCSYLSQMFTINAGTMGNLFWNENEVTVGEVLFYTRTSNDIHAYTDWADDTGWDGPYDVSSGSAITSDPKLYFQFKCVFSSTDHTGIIFPYLYKADGYVIKATYWKLIMAAESTVAFRYKTGYRNFEQPFEDKIYKKVVSVHEGSAGTFDLIADIRTATYTFSAISLTTFPQRWVSNFPASMYGPELSLEWYKNDAEDFKIKQYGIIMEPCPLI